MARRKKQEPAKLTILENNLYQLHRRPMDVDRYRAALRAAEQLTSPQRTRLYELFRDALLDPHLKALIDKRMRIVKNRRIRYTMPEGKGNSEALAKINREYFEAPWFTKFVRYILEAIFWGHSLIEFDVRNGAVHDVKLVPRQHVRPELGLVVQQPTDTHGLPFREPPYSHYCVEVQGEEYLGLLHIAVINAIYMRGGRGDFANFVEIFGSPLRDFKYDPTIAGAKEKMNEVAKNSGNAAAIVSPMGIGEVKVHNGVQAVNTTIHSSFLEAMKDELSVLILGGTMTVKDGSSYSQAEVHANEQEAVAMEDMRLVHDILNWGVLEKLINLGLPLSKDGYFQFEELSRIPISEQIENDLKLAQTVPIPASYFYEKYNLPQPKEGEAVAGSGSRGTGDGGQDAEPKTQNPEEDEDETDRELRQLYKPCPKCADDTETRNLDDSDLDSILQTLLEFAQNYSGGDILQSPQFQTLVQQQGDLLAEAVLTGYGPITQAVDQAAADHLRQNVYVFSGFKSYQMLRKATDLLQDAQGNPRPFTDVLKDVQKLHKTYVKNYLKAEYQHAIASSTMASKWQKYQADKDLIDLKYDAVNDGRTRPTHRELDNIIRPVDAPFWDTYYPPNGWGCRCTTHRVLKGTQGSKKKIDDLPAPDKPMFKGNVGKDGVIFPSGHPYYKAHKKRKEDIQGKVDDIGKDYSFFSPKKKFTPPTAKEMNEITPLAKNLEAVPNAPFIFVNRDDPQKAMFIKAAQDVSKLVDLSRFGKGVAIVSEDLSYVKNHPRGEFNREAQHALQIMIDPVKAKGDILTVYHELGHYVDFIMKHISLEETGKIKPFLKALHASKGYQAILEQIDGLTGLLTTFEKESQEYKDALNELRYYKYLASEKEAFARAFSQYAAVQTNNKTALQYVFNEIEEHWELEDFKALNKALRKLLK